MGAGRHHDYDVDLHTVTDNDWSGKCFWLGAVCILAVVTLPQLSTMVSIFSCASSDNARQQPGMNYIEVSQRDDDSQQLAVNSKYKSRDTCIQRVVAIEKQLPELMQE